jgi:hypothetical protein
MPKKSCKVCGELGQEVGHPCARCGAVVPSASSVELQGQAREPNFTTNKAKRDVDPPAGGRSTSRL